MRIRTRPVKAMVQKPLEAEAVKLPEPKLHEEITLGVDTSKKAGLQSVAHSESTAMGTSASPAPHSHEDTVSAGHRKVVGETTAGTISLLSASVEKNFSSSPRSVQIDLLRSELVGLKPVVPAAGVSSFQYHVLAVDDSRTDQRVIEKLLKTSSYKVTTVSSALKALEVLGLSESCPSSIKKLDINLIMTDYCMPEMTGYDLLKRVKAETSALKEIPVVVMSSENDSTRIKRCLAEGAEEFIIKPVQMADVKRLRDHIRPPSSSSSSTSGESSGSTSGKRKAEPREALEVTCPERRPRLSEVFVS